jgi:catechol 2,3-dioxygenase-like lactoylglutathione lyase family enzyme
MRRYDPERAPNAAEWLALDEQERIALMEKYHRVARLKLPNVMMHAAIHAIVENQIAGGHEPVVRAMARLASAGPPRHDALHAIGSVLAEHIFDLLHDAPAGGGNPMVNYDAAVECLTAEGWRRGRSFVQYARHRRRFTRREAMEDTQMKRTWTIIGVRDVARSFHWYQSLLGLRETTPAHEYWGQILDADGTVLLCLHEWGAHEHPSLTSPGRAQPGNGLLLFFRVDDFDIALARARNLVTRLEEEPHMNPATGTMEFTLRDPDGYYVMVSAWSAD